MHRFLKYIAMLLLCSGVICNMFFVSAAESRVICNYDFSSAQPFNTDTVCSIADTGDEFYSDALVIKTSASDNTGGALYGEYQGFAARAERILLSFDVKPMQTDTFFSFIARNKNGKTDFRLNLKNGAIYSTNDTDTSEMIEYMPGEWYGVDILLDYTVHMMETYINGEYKGNFAIKNPESEYLNGFFAGVWQQGTNGLCYMDNLRISEIYAPLTAEVKEAAADKIEVLLNESISKECIDNIKSDILIKSAENGSIAEISDICVTGRSIKITLREALEKNSQYAVTLPKNIRSITNKTLDISENIYFISKMGKQDISNEQSSIDFEDGMNGKNIAVNGTNEPNYMVVSEPDTGNHMMKLTAQRRTDGKNTAINFKVSGDDENQDILIIKYDIMLAQSDSFAFLHQLIDTNGKPMLTSIFNAKNRFMIFKDPTINADYKTCMNSTTSRSAIYTEISDSVWHEIMIKLDRTKTELGYDGTTEILFDGHSVGVFETQNISGGNGVLGKITFFDFGERTSVVNDETVTWGSSAGDILYIDNIRVGYQATDKVAAVTVYADDKEYGPLSTDIPDNANRIDIRLSAAPDISSINKANISLYDGEEYLDFDIEGYDVNSQTIRVNLLGGLCGGKRYTISINNLRTVRGNFFAEYTNAINITGDERIVRCLNTRLDCISISDGVLHISGQNCRGSMKISALLKRGKEVLADDIVTADDAGNFTADFILPEYGAYIVSISDTAGSDEFEFLYTDAVNPISAEVICEKTGHIYFDPAGIDFIINVYGTPLDNSDYEISYKLCSMGQEICRKAESCLFNKGTNTMTVHIDLSDSETKYGIFNIYFTVEDKTTDIVYEADTRFSCINAIQDGIICKKYGMANHFTAEIESVGTEYTRLQSRIGISCTREEIAWQDFEKTADVYELNENRRSWLENSHEAELEPFVILAFSNPAVTSENPPHSEDALNSFADYVYELVSRVGDYASDFEVWNEFNIEAFNPDGATAQDYRNLLEYAYNAAKRANKDCRVYGMAAANNVGTLEWMEQVLSAGGGEFMDAISVHPYPYSDMLSPEESNVEELVSGISELLEKYNLDLPIIASEYGWKSAEGYVDSEECQAKYNVRAAALTYDYFEKTIWFKSTETGRSSDAFAFMRSPGSEIPFEAKPVYAAMANFIKMTNDKQLIEKEKNSEGIYQYVFKGGDNEYTYMLWINDEDMQYNLKLDNTAFVRVFDMYGNEKNTECENGEYTLKVGGEPIYLLIYLPDGIYFKKDEKVINSLTGVGDIIKTYVPISDNNELTLMYAKYKDNKLIDISLEKICGSQERDIEVENADCIKVFVWHGMKPVMSAGVIR